jgi:hypothetical protein
LDLAMRKPLVALTTLIATLALIGPASALAGPPLAENADDASWTV